jgi:pimeloyl-ACP methyl ester carboxylesterase
MEDVSFAHHQVPAAGCSVHVVEAGAGAPVLLLHGWPESWRIWHQVMALPRGQARLIAIDLPGVGQSKGEGLDGTTGQLAGIVHSLVEAMELADLTLVGHDVGGMIAYSYLRRFGDVARVVIMDTLVPGVHPWDQAIRRPELWHFAMHSVPGLPEALVRGRQRVYFDYFYDVLTPDPRLIDAALRAEFAAAYDSDEALSAGFDWYRGFRQDARDNIAASEESPVGTPMLYLRGDHEAGDIASYVEGFRSAGVRKVQAGVIPEAGHFAPQEAPEATWHLIEDFSAGPPGRAGTE